MNVKRIFSHPYFSLVVALLFLAAMVSYAVLSYAQMRPGAPMIYAIEDPYIHMAMAKNMAMHGVLGVNPDGFTASTSSILWTLSLALYYKILGVTGDAPFWLNLVFACLAIWQAWRILRRAAGDRPWLLSGGLVGFVFFVPLAPVILGGMETALHILLALLFLESVVDELVDPQAAVGRARAARLVLLAGLFSMVRYENLAMIGFASALLFFSRRFALSGWVLAGAIAPVLLFGAYSVAQGWQFLPNSLIIRSSGGILTDPLAALPGRIGKLWNEPHLFAWMLAVLSGLVLDLRQPLPGGRGRWIGVIFVLVLMTHVLVDHFGYFYRYEAYVMALGTLAVAALWGPRIGRMERSTEGELRALLAGLVIFLTLMPLYSRGMEAIRATPYAMANIYDQHYQIARFLKEYYPGTAIGLHDIGLAGLIADVYVVDLVGLANRETALAFRRSPEEWTQAMDSELRRHNVTVVVAYPGWVGPFLPPGWKAVGSWTVEQRWTVGNAKMSFYAQDEAAAQALRDHLAEYAPHLPATVEWQQR